MTAHDAMCDGAGVLSPLPRRYRHALAVLPDGQRRLRHAERGLLLGTLAGFALIALAAGPVLKAHHDLRPLVGTELVSLSLGAAACVTALLVLLGVQKWTLALRRRRDVRRSLVVQRTGIEEEVDSSRRLVSWSDVRAIVVPDGRLGSATVRGSEGCIRFDAAFVPEAVDVAEILALPEPSPGYVLIDLDSLTAPTVLRGCRDVRKGALLADVASMAAIEPSIDSARRRASRIVAWALCAVFLLVISALSAAFAFNARVTALGKQERWAEQLRLHDAVIELLPDVALLRFRRALTLYHLGRFDDARTELEKARELDRRLKWISTLAAILADSQAPSLDGVHALVANWPSVGVGRHRIAVGRRLLLLDRKAQARRWFEQAARNPESSRDARIALAEADLLDGRMQDALARLPDSDHSDRVRVLLTRGLAHRCAGKPDDAGRDFDDARVTIAGRAPAARAVLGAELDLIEGRTPTLADGQDSPRTPGPREVVRFQLTERLVARCRIAIEPSDPTPQ